MISKEEGTKIAHLAKIEIEQEKIADIAGDMQKILDYMQVLTEISTDNIIATAHPVAILNVYDEDTPIEALSNTKVFCNAPEHNDKFFLVPKVVDK